MDEDAVSSQPMLPLPPPPPQPAVGAETGNREPAPAYTEHPDSTSESRLRISSGGRFARSDEFIREPDEHSMVTLPAGGLPETFKRNHYLTSAFCHIYGIFFITLGLLITVSDPFSHYNYTPIYAIILCIVGLIYLLYLVGDIWIEEEKDKKAQQQSDGDVNPRKNQHYTFDLSKHASNFYLKLGAAGFALGHLVHFALLFMIQYSFMAVSRECMDASQMVLDVVYSIYSFMQLIFIFKYNNIIILRHKILARFGFMQFIATSITFWVWSIVRETQLAMYAYEYNKKSKGNQSTSSITDNYADCFRMSPTVQSVFKNFSPYLFPFTVEFNIIMVGFFLIIWLNIGRNIDNEKPHNIIGTANTPGSVHSLDMLDGQPSKFMIYADCHASSRGIMAGFLVLVIIVAHLMMCFILANINEQSLTTAAIYISESTKLGLHSLMLVTVIAAFMQTSSLDVNPHPISSVDDILLLICIPGFLLDSTLTMFATVHYVNVIKFIDSAINVIQVLFQTAFLIDRMRRCCNSRELRRSKPGRQLIMFLLIVNVTMWIFNTFSYKSPESFDERYEFFGKKVWTVLGHVSLPLIMFYRFHSSVCLADIWQLGYQSSEH